MQSALKSAPRPPAPAAVPPQTPQNLSLREFLQAVSVAETAGAAETTQVARLSAQQKSTPMDPGTISSDGADWTQLLDLVQDFGARVRRAGALAQDLTARSQEMVKTSQTAAEAATARADRAEAAARDNAIALERLREQVRSADARARLAEEQLRVAQASEAEARGWLNKISAALRSECDGLGGLFASAPTAGSKAA